MANAAVVFKKTSPNGKISAYLSKRDFVDNLKETAPIDGVIIVEKDFMSGKSLYVQAVVTYRYGREQDEVMGLHFARDFILINEKVEPPKEISPLVKKLVSKLGDASQPMRVVLPTHAPPSVTVETSDLTGLPIGITYNLIFYASTKKEEQPARRGCVTIAVRKIQEMPFAYLKIKQPKTLVTKNFVAITGKTTIELSLEKDIFCQGDTLSVATKIINKSKRSIKCITCQIIQKIDVTITKKTVYNVIAEIESRDNCPILPSAELTRVFLIQPTATNFRGKKHGVALDGRVKDSDVHLACSTLNAAGDLSNDSLGIVISYTIKIKLNCGALGGELACEVPFRLVYPSEHQESLSNDLAIEEFSKFRRGTSIDIEA